MQYLIEGESQTTVFKAQLDADWRIKKLFQFLQISPTYHLAHQLRTKKADDKHLFPNDFDTVLQVYDDLGDVWNLSLERWWTQNAQQFFKPVVKPEPTLVAKLDELSIRDLTQIDLDHTRAFNETYDELGRFWSQQYANQLFPDCAIIAVPLRGDAATMKAKVNRMIDLQFNKVKHPPNRAKYGFNSSSRARKITLEKYLFAVHLRASDPSLPLSDIGDAVTAKFGHLKPQSVGQHQPKRELESQTSAMFRSAERIAEWAARLRFVHQAKLEHVTETEEGNVDPYRAKFDFSMIGEQLRNGKILKNS